MNLLGRDCDEANTSIGSLYHNSSNKFWEKMMTQRSGMARDDWKPTTGSPLRTLITTAAGSSHRVFLEEVCSRISDDMLSEIASADYGSDYPVYLDALTLLRDDEFGKHLVFHEPSEVLSLFRFSEFGDNRYGQTARTKSAFHLMRAFCCALILDSHSAPPIRQDYDGNNIALIQLLQSACELGAEDEARLPAFLCWLIPRTPRDEEELAFYGVALVWAMVRAGRASGDDAAFILSVIDASDAEFVALRQFRPDSIGMIGDRWLLGWTHYCQYLDKWIRLGDDLGVLAEGIQDERLRIRLKELSRWLTVDGAYREST